MLQSSAAKCLRCLGESVTMKLLQQNCNETLLWWVVQHSNLVIVGNVSTNLLCYLTLPNWYPCDWHAHQSMCSGSLVLWLIQQCALPREATSHAICWNCSCVSLCFFCICALTKRKCCALIQASFVAVQCFARFSCACWQPWIHDIKWWCSSKLIWRKSCEIVLIWLVLALSLSNKCGNEDNRESWAMHLLPTLQFFEAF